MHVTLRAVHSRWCLQTQRSGGRRLKIPFLQVRKNPDMISSSDLSIVSFCMTCGRHTNTLHCICDLVVDKTVMIEIVEVTARGIAHRDSNVWPSSSFDKGVSRRDLDLIVPPFLNREKCLVPASTDAVILRTCAGIVSKH